MREFQDRLQKAENAKTDYRWLILTFIATWWLASLPVQAEEDLTYGRTALIEITPVTEFLPTVALLDDGEFECSSADGFTIVQSYPSGTSIVSTHKIMTAQRNREATPDCRITEREQIVHVLMIYTLLLSTHPQEKWAIARVRFGSGIEHYVDAGALEFF